MKKFTLAIAAFLLIMFSYAQSFEMKDVHSGEVIENGAKLKLNTDIGENALFDAQLYNISEETKNVMVSIELLQSLGPRNVVLEICWDMCISDWSPEQTFGSVEIVPGGLNLLDVAHRGPLVEGITELFFKFYDVNNEDDTFEVTLEFIVGNVNIPEIAQVSTKAFPNPASSDFTINYDFSRSVSQAQVTFTNIVGVVVKEELLKGVSGSAKFDVSAFAPGIYFYTIKADGKVIETRKMVVSR